MTEIRQRIIGLLAAHAPGLRPAPGLHRLGPGRWRGLAARGGAPSASLYFSEADGTLLLARKDSRRLAITVHGRLSETSALNLGDCLVLGLEQGTRRFDLDLGRTGRSDPDALALVDSLARHLARQDEAWSITTRAGDMDILTLKAARIRSVTCSRG